ncbi:MAG: hypothetical protein KVP17_003956 [Porospora cf. gigantea B]|nr:MAG: hypothetical protein KVP17_003956 [Porospora cf. gigantea B]
MSGTYIGHAVLEHEERVYRVPFVMSTGFNPYFDNAELTIEPHLLGSVPDDFYGARLALTMQAIIRTESGYASFTELVRAIQLDCDTAIEVLKE